MKRVDGRAPATLADQQHPTAVGQCSAMICHVQFPSLSGSYPRSSWPAWQCPHESLQGINDAEEWCQIVARFPGIQPCSTSPSKNHLVRALTVQLCFSFSGKERLSAGSREICWDPIFLCYWTSVFVILSSMLAAVVTGNRDLCICKTSEHNPNNHRMWPCEFLKFTVLICNLEWNVCPRCCFQPTQWLWLELDWCFHSF